MPKISVIIPIYNSEKYLRECLDSIINQTLKDIEIICVNDGSTDLSIKILEEYKKNNSLIKIIDKKNEGVSIARNIGIQNAIGDYIMFIDSDDYIEKECLYNSYKKILEKESDILCFGVNEFINEKKIPRYDSKIIQENCNKENLDINIKKFFMLNACGKLFKTKFIKDNKILFPSQIKICEDGIFNLFCLYKNPKYSLLNQNLYNYRFHADSVCHVTKNMLEADIEAFKYIINSKEFKNTNEENQIVTIEKFLLHFMWDNNQKYYLKNLFLIKKVKFFMYQNIDKKILKQCDLTYFKYYSLYKYFLKNIFSIYNEYSSNKKYKVITLLWVKIKFQAK